MNINFDNPPLEKLFPKLMKKIIVPGPKTDLIMLSSLEPRLLHGAVATSPYNPPDNNVKPYILTQYI